MTDLTTPSSSPSEDHMDSRDHAPSDGGVVLTEAAGRMAYRGWWIEYAPKPIPASCGVDWDFWHDNFDASYEGPEDGWVGNGLCGNAASLEACKAEIDEREDGND